jgi:hypothetical protein
MDESSRFLTLPGRHHIPATRSGCRLSAGQIQETYAANARKRGGTKRVKKIVAEPQARVDIWHRRDKGSNMQDLM